MLKGFFRSHPNYLVGVIVWILAIATILLFPKISPLKRNCNNCDEYKRFVSALSANQKSNLLLFESAVINVADRFFYISMEDESDLERDGLITQMKLEPIISEKMRRLIIVNSLLDSMSPKERDLVLNKKAAIIYRNGDFILIGEKEELDSIH